MERWTNLSPVFHCGVITSPYSNLALLSPRYLNPYKLTYHQQFLCYSHSYDSSTLLEFWPNKGRDAGQLATCTLLEAFPTINCTNLCTLHTRFGSSSLPSLKLELEQGQGQLLSEAVSLQHLGLIVTKTVGR